MIIGRSRSAPVSPRPSPASASRLLSSCCRYLRFGLSYRDVEELLAERGVEVDHVTIYRWVLRFTPLLAEAARPCRHVFLITRDSWLCSGVELGEQGVWE
jgi:hypothetical protein